MSFQVLTRKQMDEKKNTKPLEDFFKNPDGKPYCFGEFGDYQNVKKCSDCKFKKECYKLYSERKN